MKKLRKRTRWVLMVNTESCDEYGPWLFDSKPTDDQIEKLLRKYCSAEWPEDPEEVADGPGFRGSCCHIKLSEGK